MDNSLFNALRVVTPRELEVMFQVACGCTNREIAVRLGISVDAVKSRIKYAKKKIKVTNRYDIALWLVEHGLATERAVLCGITSGPVKLETLLQSVESTTPQ